MSIFDIAKLRVIAATLDPNARQLINGAADTIENQQQEVEALKLICEKQAELCGRVAAMALDLDALKAERDAMLAVLRRQADCEVCLHDGTHVPCFETVGELHCATCAFEKGICCKCDNGSNWEWNGGNHG